MSRSKGRRDPGHTGEQTVLLDPFALFCAYHLGLAPDGTRGFLNLHQVARCLRCTPQEVEEALKRHGLTPERLLSLDFDLASAQADISLSPAGVDLKDLAAMHFEAFLVAPPRARDWEKELARDQAENDRIFGPGRKD
jgi:hypothetical protein